MKAIEKAAKAIFEYDWPKDTWERLGPGHHQNRYTAMSKAGITAFLDAILADPEAMERVFGKIMVAGGYAKSIIEALKQEVER